MKNTTQHNSDYTQFIFFGRLTKEKGWDCIIQTRDRLVQEEKKNPGGPFSRSRFLIFGDGPYRETILSFAKKHRNISYFGRKPRNEIERYLAASDYTLMPSLFLETFGLTALESLCIGVPVVAFSKGGLKPFLLQDGAINEYPGNTSSEQLYNCIRYLINNTPLSKKQQQCEQASTLAYKYHHTNRIKHFTQTIHTENKEKNILLLSDYRTKLYGIETHLHDLKHILEENGYKVHIYGATIKKNRFNKLLRTLLLPLTTCNIYAARKIKKAIKKHKPDILWWHSTARRLGWFPLWICKNFQGKQRVTYHDFGYFHPFPRNVYDTKDIPQRTRKAYYKAGKTKNPFLITAIWCKFMLLSNIKKQYQHNIDKHFVPSSFFLPIVEKRLSKDKKGKVLLLEHFFIKK